MHCGRFGKLVVTRLSCCSCRNDRNTISLNLAGGVFNCCRCRYFFFLFLVSHYTCKPTSHASGGLKSAVHISQIVIVLTVPRFLGGLVDSSNTFIASTKGQQSTATPECLRGGGFVQESIKWSSRGQFYIDEFQPRASHKVVSSTSRVHLRISHNKIHSRTKSPKYLHNPPLA